jgi:nitrile hydratase accessory protein
MSDRPLGAYLDRDGPTAPPRANGELVFDAPWQSRIFGLTMTLCEQRRFVWDEFRDLLIEEIGAWDRAHADAETEAYQYWEHWLAALTRLVGDKELLAPAELSAREREYAARPHGHDHSHPSERDDA